jgi:replicative DNA helicase
MNLYSEESEQMILSAIINYPETLYDLESLIDSQDFFFLSHQLLFDGVRYLFNKNAYDVRSLTHLLREREKLDTVGGLEYIGKLKAQDTKRKTVKLYAEKVKEFSIFRKGKSIADRIYDSIQNGTSLEQFTLETNESFNTFDTVRENKMLHISKILEKRQKEIKSGVVKSSPLIGFKEIDEWMRGIGRDRLIVVAGRPGTGKTALSLTIAKNVSQQDYGVVPIFSMEMSEDELSNRLLSEMSGVPFYAINSEDYQGLQGKKVLETSEHLKSFGLYIDGKANMTFDYIVSQCRRLKREHGKLGVIMIDYLGLIRLNLKQGQNKSDAIGEMTSGFKNLAKELGCSIILLSQMNRETDKRASKRPVLSDLRDSGSIEQDADMVIFLYKDLEKAYQNKEHIDFICAKGRQTGLADFEMWFTGSVQRFEVKT